MRPRRGYTLLECVIALGLMAVVVSVALQLLYASDVALGRERTASAGAGAMAAMLGDVAADARPSSSASADGVSLTVGGAKYSWDAGRRSTVRQSAGDLRAYPGVRAKFGVSGKMVTVEVAAGKAVARTSCYMRR
jgi:prepilin-type N-terminal cleavage/methylation domain-containing protein